MVVGLAACYPGGPENLGDIGIVLTLKNPEGNFSGMMTYAMEDTVVELKKPDDDSSQPINPQFNPLILEELQTQMAKAGFAREMDPAANKPDVWLSVGAVESEVWLYWYSWGYYGGYPGWGGYYPPYVGATSFQQGTIVWQLHDLRGIDDPTDPDAKPPLNWVGSINGALQKNTSTTASDISSGIQQGFAQSPYITAQSAGK
jgi:hypothetical protein